MLHSQSISQIEVDNPDVYAFRITGEVAAADLEAMARTMNDAFDRQSSVSMILIFVDYDGLGTGACFDMETLEAQFRSLANVDKYAVVGAPDYAATMIKVMDKVIPVDARTFDAVEEQAAWIFVGARPTTQTRTFERGMFFRSRSLVDWA